MKSNKLLKGAGVAALATLLPLSQAAQAEVNISGWINEGIIFYDDGVGSDAVQVSDNGTTLGSRITFSGSADLPAGLTAGFEVILEPQDQGAGVGQPIFANQNTGFDNTTGLLSGINTLGHNINIGGAWGKVTVGLQTTPTDNIAVLADPSLTLWDSIGVVFRGNGFDIMSSGAVSGLTWGSLLQCQTLGGAGIGLDCNGIYRNGVRYDLPAFGPVSVAVGYSNDDIYDVAAKYNGSLGRVNAILHGGYTVNNGVAGPTYESTELFQTQIGLMDTVTGLFFTGAYQYEEADTRPGVTGVSDDSDVYWFKAGIKKQWNSLGDTAIAFQYGSYNDQYGAIAGITGSEVERFGGSINQYFGSSLIIYGSYEVLEADVDGTAFSGVPLEDLDLFTLGGTFFF